MDEVPDRINAAALLLARGAPRRPGLLCGRHSLSYADLQRAVARAATRWREHGIEPGEVVMLRGDHGLDHVVAFLGAMWAGAVPVPLRASAVQAEDAPGLVHFAVDGTRTHAGIVNGDGAARWTVWTPQLDLAAASPAVRCEPWAPACWTEPRTWHGGSARVLPHRFALTLNARSGVLPLAPARTMLGVLRALRRGATVVLQQPVRADAVAA